MERMIWKRLLSPKRVKGLDGEPSSVKLAEDPRSEFERDFGRSVFSTPVRRLQDKAQVFPLEQHDAIRTRLTHSLEVSSVSRSLGVAAEKVAAEKKEIEGDLLGAIPTIAATCGLIHDLGNPPFGHAGEQAICDWFAKRERFETGFFDDFAQSGGKKKARNTQFARDFLNFDGNAQTQRLLSRLQVLADDYGLNMTCATLSGSCKYVATSNATDPSNQATKKHGYFASENDLIAKIRAEVGTDASRNPIAFLVEASDDIVYSTVDLEDGIKKGCLRWHFLEEELQKRAKSDCLTRILAESHKKIDPARFKGPMLDEAMAVAFRTFAIAEMVVATRRVFETNYESIMNGECPHELLYQSEAGGLASACKKIGLEYVYVSPEILKLEVMGRKIISDLLDLYWEAAKEMAGANKMSRFQAKIYSLISSNYRRIFENNLTKASQLGIPSKYFGMQLITDQISGMTDSFAVTLHRELTNG